MTAAMEFEAKPTRHECFSARAWFAPKSTVRHAPIHRRSDHSDSCGFNHNLLVSDFVSRRTPHRPAYRFASTRRQEPGQLALPNPNKSRATDVPRVASCLHDAALGWIKGHGSPTSWPQLR